VIFGRVWVLCRGIYADNSEVLLTEAVELSQVVEYSLMNNVWICIAKIKPMDGCDINMDGCEFYYVDALVPVSNSTERLSMDTAIEKLRAALFEHKFELSEVLLMKL